MNMGAASEWAGWAWGALVRHAYDPVRGFWLYTVRKNFNKGYFNGRWPEGLE